jgi:putative PEP-CTERM system TPR-repeat lipoprotein
MWPNELRYLGMSSRKRCGDLWRGRRLGAVACGFLLLPIAACQRLDPTSELAAAQQSYAAGDLATAVIHVSNVLQATPDDAEAHLLRAKIALAVGEAEVAAVESERAAALGASQSETVAISAEAALQRGDHSRALAILDETPSTVSESVALLLLRARVLLRSGALPDAEQSLERAMRSGAAGPPYELVRAQLAAARGDTDQALSVIDAAIDVTAGDPALHAFRGQIRLQAGENAGAVADYARAADLYRATGSPLFETQTLFNVVRAGLAASDVEAAAGAADRIAELAPQAPLASYARALVAYRGGRFDEAAAALQSALGSQPDNSAILTLLGAVQLALGNVGQAEQSLLKVVARDPLDTAAVKLLAETRLRQQRPHAALEVLLPLAELVTPDPQVSLLTGLANLQVGNVQEGLVHLEGAVELDPGNPMLALELSRAYSTAGRASDSLALLRTSFGGGSSNLDGRLLRLFSEARAGSIEQGRAALDELLEDFPGDARALTGAAMYHQLIGEPREALGRLEEAVEADERFSPARVLLGTLLARDGRSAEAEAQLREALIAEPQSVQARALLAQLTMARGAAEEAEQILSEASGEGTAPLQIMLAQLYIDRGRNDEALGTLRLAAGAAPRSLPVRIALARAELRAGNAGETAKTAEALRTEFPDQAAGHLLEYELSVSRREYAAAVESAQRAYDLERSWQTTIAYLTALRLVDRAQDALALTERWVAENPNHVPGRLALAGQLQTAGRDIESLREYDAVLAIDSENVAALNNAAWIAHEAGEERALDLARRAAALAPDNGGVLDTLGFVLLGQNREAEAVGHLERAAELTPQLLAIRYHLAQALARLDRTSEARAVLESVLREERPFTERAAAQALLNSL